MPHWYMDPGPGRMEWFMESHWTEQYFINYQSYRDQTFKRETQGVWTELHTMVVLEPYIPTKCEMSQGLEVGHGD